MIQASNTRLLKEAMRMLVSGTARFDDLLDAVNRTFHGNLAWCMEYDGEAQAFVSGRVQGAAAEAFHDGVFRGFDSVSVNPWLRAGMLRDPWRTICAEDLPKSGDPRMSPEFSAFIDRLGLHEHLAVILTPPPRQLVFAVFRERGRPYLRRELVAFEALFPGLRSLMALGRDHPAALHGPSLVDLVHRTVQPRVVVDASLRPVDANRAAELLLATGKPIGVARGGKIDLGMHPPRRLVAAIERARWDIRRWTATAPTPVDTPHGIVNITTCGGTRPRIVLDIRENWPHDERLVELYSGHLVNQDGWLLQGDPRLTYVAVLRVRYGAMHRQIWAFLSKAPPAAPSGSRKSGKLAPPPDDGIWWDLRDRLAAIRARAGGDMVQLGRLMDYYLDR